MKRLLTLIPTLFMLSPAVSPLPGATLDRHALVTRHNLEWNELAGEVPVGNGEFCFNADGTGLQTFGGATLAHWAWHSEPLPSGFTAADVPPTGTVDTGRLQGPMRQAAKREELNGWMFRNPHPVNLARLRFLRSDGSELEPSEITQVSRRYDLWTGLHTSRFTVDGQTIEVQTCVHPKSDVIALRADSPLLRDGKLVVGLDFPYPSVNNRSAWTGDWDRPEAHASTLVSGSLSNRAEILRIADAAEYRVAVAWSRGCAFTAWGEAPRRRKLAILKARYGNNDSWMDAKGKLDAAIRDDRLALTVSYEQFGDPLPGRSKQLQLTYSLDGTAKSVELDDGKTLAIQVADWRHTFKLVGAKDGPLEFVCGFTAKSGATLPTVAETQRHAAEHWQDYWTRGGAIDLSGSKDPRWRELERRIVLSQYLMAAQSAGSWPSAESGLLGVDGWSGQFHMEMTWWHLAHYGLWDRWPLAARGLECYRRFLPVARQLAQQFDYRGAKWGKQVGPEGRTAPWVGSFVLSWQQPHPLFFAELEYRLRPDSATLDKMEGNCFRHGGLHG